MTSMDGRGPGIFDINGTVQVFVRSTGQSAALSALPAIP
jgi:hypothetical protein